MCKNPFLQNTIGWLLLTVALSIVVQEELANEIVNYDKEIKVYQVKSEV